MDVYRPLVLIFINLIASSKGTLTVTDPSGRNAVTFQGNLTLRCTVWPTPSYVFWFYPDGGRACSCYNTADSECIPGRLQDNRVNCTSDFLQRQFDLTITNVAISDEGGYKCTDVIEEDTLFIYVQVPITSVDVVIPTTSPVNVSENLPSTFVCETSAGRPQATITWYKQLVTSPALSLQGGIITIIPSDTSVITRSTLQFTPTRSDHDYRVYCTAYNIDVSFSSNSKQLYVQYSPDNEPVLYESNGSIFRIRDGKQQSLSCFITESRPLASLSWNCFNGTVQNQSTSPRGTSRMVMWTAAMAQNGRQCTCLASHPILTDTHQVYVTIEVLYPPTLPTFTVQSQPVTATVSVIEGNSVSVTCSSTSNPPPVYAWSHRGVSQNSDVLTLTSVSTSNNGSVYTCNVTNTMQPALGGLEYGSNRDSITLNVLFPPSAPVLRYSTLGGPIISSAFNVVRGGSFSIYCMAEGNPAPSYQWSGQSANHNKLTVTGIQKDTSWICTATNAMVLTGASSQTRSSTAAVNANVLYPPKVQYLTNDTVIENATFLKECLVNPGNPEATYVKWIRVKDNAVVSNDQTLTIGQVSRDNAGTYRCTSKNTMQPTGEADVNGTDSATFVLTVYYSASITEFTINGAKGNGPVTYNENTTVTIICMVDSNPESDITIYRDTSVKDTASNKNEITYTVKEASCYDAGIYTCSARNQYIGNTNHNISRQVLITCPPRPFQTNNYTYSSALNETVTLNLTVTAYPEPTFRWYKQDREITTGVSKNGHQTTLTLEQITQNDLGQYKVVVTNNQGTLEHLFFVVAHDTPQQPSHVTIKQITHKSAVIQWVQGFNGGREQTFHIEHWPSSQNNIKIIQNISDTGESPLNITLTKLDPATEYTVQVYAENSIGKSIKSTQATFTTIRVPEVDTQSSVQSSKVIAGVAGGLAACLFVMVVVLLLIRKYTCAGLQRCIKSKSGPELEQRDEINSLHVYVNTTANPDAMGPNDNIERNVYEGLNMSHIQPQLYDQLHQSDDETYVQDIDKRNAYENFNNASEQPRLSCQESEEQQDGARYLNIKDIRNIKQKTVDNKSSRTRDQLREVPRVYENIRNN